MKNLLTAIALITSTGLFAQNSSSQQTQSSCQLGYAGKSGDCSMSRDNLIANKGIYSSCTGIEITSFDVVIANNNSTIKQSGVGNHFNKQEIDAISNTPNGGHVIIQNVKGKDGSGNMVAVSGMNITISEDKK